MSGASRKHRLVNTPKNVHLYTGCHAGTEPRDEGRKGMERKEATGREGKGEMKTEVKDKRKEKGRER